MKSFNNLFKIITDPDVISRCINKAAKGKRWRKEVREVLENREKHIKKIQEILENETFELKHHVARKIVERGKERVIVQPDFKYELVIQHLIVYALEEILMPRMYEYSCASIPNRGISYGKKALERWIRRQNKSYDKDMWVYKLDIRHFFESVNRDVLKSKLSKLIRDKKFLSLCFKMIDCDSVDGLPLGFVTSQWFANFYLTDFDRWVKQTLKLPFYMRYMDDIVMIGFDKMRFHSIRARTERYLETECHLTIKGDWQVFKFTNNRPIDFMGFKFYVHKTTLRKCTLKYTARAVLRASKRDHITRHDACSLISRLGWMKQARVHDYFKRRIKPLVDVRSLKKGVSDGSKFLQIRKFDLSGAA